MYQRLALLRNYLRQPDIPAYAVAEAANIAKALAADYEGYGDVPGSMLVECVQKGRKQKAVDLIDEIQWLLLGGDKTVEEPPEETTTDSMRAYGTQVDVAMAILDQNAKTCSKAIAEIDSIELLDALDEVESADKQRKTVFEAIASRRNILTEESKP